MKRKTDNFNKFFDKKRNSAIKEAFRQEKKAVKKERKDAIERHFEEKRKAREEKYAADADRDAIRKEVSGRKKPTASGKSFVPGKSSTPMQKVSPNKSAPGAGKPGSGKEPSAQKAAARKSRSNKDKGKPIRDKQARASAPGKGGSAAPAGKFPLTGPIKSAPIQKASADNPIQHKEAPVSGKPATFQKAVPVSGKFTPPSGKDPVSASDKGAPASGKFTSNKDKGKPGAPVFGRPAPAQGKQAFDSGKGAHDKGVSFQKAAPGKQPPPTAPSASVDPNALPLNKYIAHSGICSRRDAADLIREGKVSVNGHPVTEPGTKVLPTDTVKVNGKKITISRNFVYILLNKPKDYITTSEDPQGRKTVLDLIRQATTERVYPVGRLDRNTSGVLLLTNDGDLSQKLSHPKHEIKKIYHVTLDKPLTKTDFDKIAEGVKLDDGIAYVDVLAYADARDKAQVGLEIHSGRNRIVRRIFEHLGYDVRGLDRVMYAGLTKKNVQRGKWRLLTEKEIRILKYLNSSMIKTSAPKKSN